VLSVLSGVEVDDLEKAWRARERTVLPSDPANSWSWIAAARERRRPSARYLLVGTSDEPLALLSLVGSTIGRPLGSGRDRFTWFTNRPECEVARATSGCSRPFALVLPFAVASDPMIAGRHLYRPHGSAPFAATCDWDRYVRDRPQSLRKSVRNSMNRIKRSGLSWDVLHLQGAAAQSELCTLQSIEAAGRRHGSRKQLMTGRRGSFTRDVLGELIMADRASLYLGLLCGEPVAYLVVVHGRQESLAYTMAARADLDRYGVGTLVFDRAVRDALTSGQSFDMGNGESQFKLRWATGRTPLRDALVWSSCR